MKSIGDYIKNTVKEEGRTLKWLADRLNMNYKTLTTKLDRDTISADELLKIGLFINLNLEDMAYELGYIDITEEGYAYLPVDEYENLKELKEKNKVKVYKIIEIEEGQDNYLEDGYIFVAKKDEDGKIFRDHNREVQYELQLVNKMKFEVVETYGYMFNEDDDYVYRKTKLSGIGKDRR